MCRGFQVKYPLFLSYFNETSNFSIAFRKILTYQISLNPPSGTFDAVTSLWWWNKTERGVWYTSVHILTAEELMTVAFRFTCASRLRERFVSHFLLMIPTFTNHRGETGAIVGPKMYGIPGDPNYRGAILVTFLVNSFPQGLCSSAQHGDKAAGCLVSQSVTARNNPTQCPVQQCVAFYCSNSYNLACCFVWVCNLVANIAGGKESEGVWEQGVEENIWT